MKNLIQHFIDSHFPELSRTSDALSGALAEHICSPKFSALYAQRIPPIPSLGLGSVIDNKWRNAMSQLTDAMAAAITTLKASSSAGGPTTDQITAQIHTVVDPQVSALTASIATITSSEADDASKIADIQAALAEFTTAFAPASTPAPAAS